MTSNSEKYGVVKEGIYDGNYDDVGKGSRLKSNYTLNHRGNVPDLRGRDPLTGAENLTGVFIHSSNSNGFAGEKNGRAVSEGCLLIAPTDWIDFQTRLGQTKNFKVQVIRTGLALIPLQGFTGVVEGKYIMGMQTYQ
jgi:hypothetical protein